MKPLGLVLFVITLAIMGLQYMHMRANDFQVIKGDRYFLPFSTNQNFPNGYVWGCYNISKSLPFCNPQLSVDSRINDLVGRMT